jgi:pyruvate kinase
MAASSPAAVVVPTRSGATARAISRFRLPVWIAAPTDCMNVVRNLQFTYGVEPLLARKGSSEWAQFARDWVHGEQLPGRVALLVEGPSPANPQAIHRMEILQLT